MQAWWREGLMVPAVGLSVDAEQLLVTHAGTTSAFWRSVLEAASTVAEAVAAIRALGEDPALFRAGCMMQGHDPDPLAGPLWAAAASELELSWAGATLPFSQVHAHSSAWDWDAGALRLPPDLAAHALLDEEDRHVTITLPGGRIVGVDPDHRATPRGPWRGREVGGPQAVVEVIR